MSPEWGARRLTVPCTTTVPYASMAMEARPQLRLPHSFPALAGDPDARYSRQSGTNKAKLGGDAGNLGGTR